MKSREPVFEKSRSVENVEHMRLMALLKELVRDSGVMKAIQTLGVDYKTLTLSLKRGRLSRRMRHVLERALLEGGGSPAAEQRERNDRLEERLNDVAGQVMALATDVSKGFAAVKGDVKAFRDGQSFMERRPTTMDRGGDVQSEATKAKAEGGSAKRRSAPWRKFPDLLTLEPADGDEEVFGDAWSLIVEWRELRASHPNNGKGFAWLRDEERLLAMEVSLLEEHGLTLPPGTYPLRGLARNGQITWRKTALYDTRRALRKRELLRGVMRLCTFGQWPR